MYRKIEIAPNMADFGLMVYSNTNPIMVKRLATKSALLGDILPDATGRFLVLSILASRSFSITWL